jgi:tRNA pseudouridine55 synthase
MNGVLVVDKPVGPTSHDVVDRARAVLGLRRVGHTGTLDPFASGVLPLCVGKATRLARHVSRGDKLYRATVRLGCATTTDDLTGEPLGPPCMTTTFTTEQLRAACVALTGPIQQRPPAFSAKRIDGQRAHRLARRGVAFDSPPVVVTVHSIEILATTPDTVEIEVRCSPGTYIRALGRDLGAALGVGGHLTALRRLASGPFTLADAVAWGALATDARQRLIPLARLLTDWPAVRVGPDGMTALRHGRDLTPRLVIAGFPDAPAGPVRVLDDAGELLALASPRGFLSDGPHPPTTPALHPDTVLLDTPRERN